MRLYLEKQWSLVTLTEKLCSVEIQLRKSVNITKLAIYVDLTEDIFQSNRKFSQCNLLFNTHKLINFMLNLTFKKRYFAT